MSSTRSWLSSRSYPSNCLTKDQFFCSTWALSFFLYGRDRVNLILGLWSVKYLSRWWFRNSPPLSQSKPFSSKGRLVWMFLICSMTPVAPLFQVARASVQPVWMSVRVRLQIKSPARELPQWATVSASMNPGWEISQL